jgi:hypothetical protein
MIVAGVAAPQVVLAVHIAAAVVGLGVVFAYPVLLVLGERLERRSLPILLRLRKVIGRRIVNPGLTVVVGAGIYLASDQHLWHRFFVGWGIGAALVIGALEGSLVIPLAGRAADRAEAELATGAQEWGPELRRLRGGLLAAQAAIAALVLVTVYVMTVGAG